MQGKASRGGRGEKDEDAEEASAPSASSPFFLRVLRVNRFSFVRRKVGGKRFTRPAAQLAGAVIGIREAFRASQVSKSSSPGCSRRVFSTERMALNSSSNSW